MIFPFKKIGQANKPGGDFFSKPEGLDLDASMSKTRDEGIHSARVYLLLSFHFGL